MYKFVSIRKFNFFFRTDEKYILFLIFFNNWSESAVRARVRVNSQSGFSPNSQSQ